MPRQRLVSSPREQSCSQPQLSAEQPDLYSGVAFPLNRWQTHSFPFASKFHFKQTVLCHGHILPSLTLRVFVCL